MIKEEIAPSLRQYEVLRKCAQRGPVLSRSSVCDIVQSDRY
jgi:hypothetical protein